MSCAEALAMVDVVKATASKAAGTVREKKVMTINMTVKVLSHEILMKFGGENCFYSGIKEVG